MKKIQLHADVYLKRKEYSFQRIGSIFLDECCSVDSDTISMKVPYSVTLKLFFNLFLKYFKIFKKSLSCTLNESLTHA